ncbi:flippase [Tranquillimonas rosea]|uniref:flippase n=1 Tax=Tranquillimonas rosea TaxID=641238 RepID=UPI003BA94A34
MQKYLKNMGWLTGEKLLDIFLRLVAFLLVAKALGAEGYGMYAYAFSVASIFAIAGHMGVEGLITREIVKFPEDRPTIVGTTLALKTLGYVFGVVLLVAYAFIVPSHSEVERTLLILAACTIIVQPIITINSAWFRAMVAARNYVIPNTVGGIFGAILKITVVSLGFSAVAVGMSQTIAVALTAVLAYIVYSWRGGPKLQECKFDTAYARRLLSEGVWVMIGSVMAVIYLKIDIAMIRIFNGSELAGVYSVSATLSEYAYFLPAAVVTSFFPRLVELFSQDTTQFNNRLQRLLDAIVSLSWLLVVGVAVTGTIIIDELLGADYQQAISVLWIHILALPFIATRNVLSRWIIITKLTKFSALTQGAGAAINVLLNVILIPNFGAHGAAIATVLSYAVASYGVLYFNRSTREIFRMMTKSQLQPWRGFGELKSTFLEMRRQLRNG